MKILNRLKISKIKRIKSKIKNTAKIIKNISKK